MIKFFFLLFFAVFLSACGDENGDSDQIVFDPNGAIKMHIKVQHQDGFDVLCKTDSIFSQFGSFVKVNYSFDTLPQMGVVSDTLSVPFKNEDGNEDERDSVITHIKNYKFYITPDKTEN